MITTYYGKIKECTCGFGHWVYINLENRPEDNCEVYYTCTKNNIPHTAAVKTWDLSKPKTKNIIISCQIVMD